MATEVLYISENKLKDATSISSNVDTEHLLPHIKTAQDKWILTKLGTDLHKKLQSDIQGSSLSGNYATLVNDYIAPALVHWVMFEAILFLGFKIMNKSIVQKNSETGTPASTHDIKFIKEEVRNTAEFYTQRLVDYLCNNTDLFPEYSTNTGADVKPSKKNYFSGMNL